MRAIDEVEAGLCLVELAGSKRINHELQRLLDLAFKVEEVTKRSVLPLGAVLVVHAASVHDAFFVEEFHVGRDEDPVLGDGPTADLLAISGVRRVETVDALLLQLLRELGQVLVDDEAVHALPHFGLQFLVGGQLLDGGIVELLALGLRLTAHIDLLVGEFVSALRLFLVEFFVFE